MDSVVLSDDILLSGIVHGNYACTNHAWDSGTCLWASKMALEKDCCCVFQLSAKYDSGAGVSGASVTEEG